MITKDTSFGCNILVDAIYGFVGKTFLASWVCLDRVQSILVGVFWPPLVFHLLFQFHNRMASLSNDKSHIDGKRGL